MFGNKKILIIPAIIAFLSGCSGSLGNIEAADSVEIGLSYIAAAIVTHAVISLLK